MTAQELISGWLQSQLSPTACTWLAERRALLEADYTDRALHITLGFIPRKLGKADLQLSLTAVASALAVRDGWDPSSWSVADAARVLVLLETSSAGNTSFSSRFVDLCKTADVGESVALYRGLALYPDAQMLEAQAAEGLRTNMRSVFEAVAHRNPFARDVFTQDRWNHMVLKALFVGSKLDPILGLDQRANHELARIMCDYAHERWAAGRSVAPELWRCVGPLADDTMRQDLARAYRSEHSAEALAAGLALQSSQTDAAASILTSRPEIVEQLGRDQLTWSDIAAME